MLIDTLEIKNFRGIKKGKIRFGKHSVIIGPNNCGKTTIIEALALLLGRDQLVRNLTEHDFYNSDPQPTDRIEIKATITGFNPNNVESNPDWFRYDRGIPKWLSDAGDISPIKTIEHINLACQIAYVARFDSDSLEFEYVRYFCDVAEEMDPFDEESNVTIPSKLLKSFGFFLVPANRSWDKIISFGSELFRRVIAESSAIPADSILRERDRLRLPENPLENDERLSPIIQKINSEILKFFPEGVDLKLRITSTDSQGILDSVIPHFTNSVGLTIPSKKQGSGLVSLQRLFLLLHFGYSRIEAGLGFCIALEEPEIHLPLGVQRRLLYRLQSLTTQTIITSHSPLVAAFTEPTSLIILQNNGQGEVNSKPLLEKPLPQATANCIRRLFQINRLETVSALMHEVIVIPEGRTDYDLLMLLQKAAELKKEITDENSGLIFGSYIGLIPTQDAAVTETYKNLMRLHCKICVLVDGDLPGKQYARQLSELEQPPVTVMRWPDGWAIEDIIGWIISEEEESIIQNLVDLLPINPESKDDLILKLKSLDRSIGGLKQDIISYEIIVNVLSENSRCLERIRNLLNAIAQCSMNQNTTLFSTVEDINTNRHIHLFTP